MSNPLVKKIRPNLTPEDIGMEPVAVNDCWGDYCHDIVPCPDKEPMLDGWIQWEGLYRWPIS